MQNTYDEHEVKELFEVVFKLSAKDINDKLIKVHNRIDIAKRRWFWELLQNAKDSVPKGDAVSVRLVVENVLAQKSVKFSHNGNPFKYQDAKNLIFPYSDKSEEEDSDKSGRFGTGFLATHVLSPKIIVNGVYINDSKVFGFDFTLNRSLEGKVAIADSINNTWKQFREKRVQIESWQHNKETYDTSFRYEIEDDTLSLIKDSIGDIENSLPYALTFVPKIRKVEIIDQIDNFRISYHKLEEETKELTEHIKIYTIERTLDKNTVEEKTKVYIVVCSNGQVDIAIEVGKTHEGLEIKELADSTPMLFSPFPLIGINEFKFPLIVNSNEFLPKEERDGIWLNNDGYGSLNQQLFEQTVALYHELATFASSQNWSNTYLLFKSLKETLVLQDFNSSWFKERIQDPIKTLAKTIPLVDLENGEREPMVSLFFPHDIKESNRIVLWEFLQKLFPNQVSKREDVNYWYNVTWPELPRVTIESLTKHLSGLRTVETLAEKLQINENDAITWLNGYVGFISKEAPELLDLQEAQILPDQFGNFKRKSELDLDDDTIDLELKLILAEISKVTPKVSDWRVEMLDKRIYLELPETRVRSISKIGVAISDVIKDLLNYDNPSNDHRNIFSRLLNWCNENNTKAREYFKGIKTDALLYKTANESKIKHITDLLQNDRDGLISVEELSNLNASQIALLQDPDLALKVQLGEQVLADKNKQQIEFLVRKKVGDIFEKLFKQLINRDERFGIKKVEGEEDFLVTNISSGRVFYIEIKSIKLGESHIQMTHKQVKKAYSYHRDYILCVVPNDGSDIDEAYFLQYALFDNLIGVKLTNKVTQAIAFKSDEVGLKVEFEDEFLAVYSKYRYKISIENSIWGNSNFELFKLELLN